MPLHLFPFLKFGTELKWLKWLKWLSIYIYTYMYICMCLLFVYF